MVQQCIFENAYVVFDQTKYQKRYDGLTARFEQVKAQVETVMAEIRSRQSQRADINAFIKVFEILPQDLTEFTIDNWLGLVDYATVYSGDDIRFTFKNGQEVQA